MTKPPLRHPLALYMSEMWNVSARTGEPADATSLRLLSRYLSLDPHTKEQYRDLAHANARGAVARREIADKLNKAQLEYGQFAVHPSLIDAICDSKLHDPNLSSAGILSVATRVLLNLKESRSKRHEYVARQWMASLFRTSDELTGKALYTRLGFPTAMADIMENWKGKRGTKQSRLSMRCEARKRLEKEFDEMRETKKAFLATEAFAVRRIRGSRSTNPSFENVFRALLGRVHSRVHEVDPSVRSRKAIQLVHQFCQKEKYV